MIDTAGSIFEPATCTGCGTDVVCAPGQQDRARCLECARAAAGIDWPSGVEKGAWHPSGGGQPPGPPPDKPVRFLTCFWCGKTWPTTAATTPTWVRDALNDHEQAAHPHTLTGH